MLIDMNGTSTLETDRIEESRRPPARAKEAIENHLDPAALRVVASIDHRAAFGVLIPRTAPTRVRASTGLHTIMSAVNAESRDVDEHADDGLQGAKYEHGDVTSSLPEARSKARDDGAGHDGESREAEQVITVCESCAADCLCGEHVTKKAADEQGESEYHVGGPRATGCGRGAGHGHDLFLVAEVDDWMSSVRVALAPVSVGNPSTSFTLGS